MKVCPTCRRSLPRSSFNVRTASRDRLQAVCRECNAARARRYYADNLEKHRAAVAEQVARARAANLERIGAHLLEHPCVDCGESDLRVLDFDHRDGSRKTAEVMKLAKAAYSWKRVAEEIAKCDVRCRNCHAKVTYERMGDNWRSTLMRRAGVRPRPAPRSIVAAMASDYHRPTRFPPGMFEGFLGGEDPANLSRVAHDTAAAILSRVRENPDPAIVERLVTYTDEHGIDAIAELWSQSSAKSLPGALWRVYLLRTLIRQDPLGVSHAFQRGTEVSHTIDQVVAGAPIPAGPTEVQQLADRILQGVFTGDFAVALERAAAFCRVVAAGFASLADDADAADAAHPDRPTELTQRALRLTQLADEFTSCARLWRRDSLD